MLPGIAIPFRRTRIRAPVHTAPLPALHGWGLALRSRTGPRQAARGRCQPLRLHGIDEDYYTGPAMPDRGAGCPISDPGEYEDGF